MEEREQNITTKENNEFDNTDFTEGIKVQEIYDKHSGLTFKIPENFCVAEETGEIYKDTKDGPKRISPTSIWVTGIIQNLDDDTEKVKLHIEKRDKVKEGIFLKSQAYGSPMELANFGIPINATNSRSLIQYLAELEADNEATIPVVKAVSKLGWREGKFIPFSKDTDIVVDIDYKLQKWVNAYTSKGTLKEWVEAIRPFRNNNLFRFMISASFAAPLLKLIGHRIFIVYNWRKFKSWKKCSLKSRSFCMGKSRRLNPYI